MGPKATPDQCKSGTLYSSDDDVYYSEYLAKQLALSPFDSEFQLKI
jgi:hypothetical protein